MQSLFDFASDLGVEIEYARLRNRDGEYRHDLQLIRLRENMSARLTRSVLAHELAHAIYQDTPTRDPALHARQERRANEWAAQYLIDVAEYEEAEKLRDGHIPSIAHDLGVVTDVVETFQELLQKELTLLV